MNKDLLVNCSLITSTASYQVLVKLSYIRAILKMVSGQEDKAMTILQITATASLNCILPPFQSDTAFDAALSGRGLVKMNCSQWEGNELTYAQG